MTSRIQRAKDRFRKLLSTHVQPHTILRGELKGLQIHTCWQHYPGAILGTTERSLLRWFAGNVRPGETWLDVGAHYGYTAIALSRLVGRGGRVFAFEPVLSTAACLARTRALNRLDQLEIVPFALGEGPRMHRLRVPTIRGMADSTLHASAPTETIFSISLDAVWTSIAGTDAPIHGVKIDVQGLEFSALLGMREMLKRWTPKLVIEFHSGVDRAEVLDFLGANGYSTDFEAVDGSRARGTLADDTNYVFYAEVSVCA